jgi:hypothetical protein
LAAFFFLGAAFFFAGIAFIPPFQPFVLEAVRRMAQKNERTARRNVPAASLLLLLLLRSLLLRSLLLGRHRLDPPFRLVGVTCGPFQDIG